MRGRRPVFRGRQLVAAFLLGVAFTLSLAAAAGSWVMRHGVAVTVDGGQLNARVRDEVQRQVASELPSVLARVKNQVPGRVAAEVDRQLGDTSFVLYGVRVELPAAATEGLRARLKDEIAAEIQRQLDDIDVNSLARTWSDDAAGSLAATLKAQFLAHPLMVQVAPGVSVPISLDIR